MKCNWAFWFKLRSEYVNHQSESLFPSTEYTLSIFKYTFVGFIESHFQTVFGHTILYVNNFFCTFLYTYDIPPKWKYYPFGRQYLPINGFKFTFNGVIQVRSINQTWISTRMESYSESDWGNPTRTPFEWSLCGITSSENFNFFFLCNSVKWNHMSHWRST